MRKIRALLIRANHAGTPQAEAESALAIAYRLIVKYGLDEREVDQSDEAQTSFSEDIVSRTYHTTGPYRVRRLALRFAIASVLSCAMCRDCEREDTDTVVSIVFGTEVDIDAHEILYAAAEMLALRTMPRGDRSFRTSWFHGFTDGVERKLLLERNAVSRNTKGADLVLRDRFDRAKETMYAEIPGLTKGRESGASWADAFAAGQRAGSSFSAGGRGVSGPHGALPRGE